MNNQTPQHVRGLGGGQTDERGLVGGQSDEQGLDGEVKRVVLHMVKLEDYCL